LCVHGLSITVTTSKAFADEIDPRRVGFVERSPYPDSQLVPVDVRPSAAGSVSGDDPPPKEWAMFSIRTREEGGEMKSMKLARRPVLGFAIGLVTFGVTGCSDQTTTSGSKQERESKRDSIQKPTQSGVPGKAGPGGKRR